MNALLRPVLIALAALLIGPIAGLMTGSLTGPDGSNASTLLVSSDPLMGVLMGLAAIGLAAAMGVVSARLAGVRAGFFDAGLVLCWAAWRLGPIREVLLDDNVSGRLTTLALEGALFGAAGLLAAGLILAAAWREPYDDEGLGPCDKNPIKDTLAIASGLPALAGGLVGALAALAAGALIARSGLAGQTVFSGITGAIAAAAVGRMVAAAMGRDAAPTVFVASCAIAAAVGPVIELIASGPDVQGAVLTGTLLGTGRISALAWMGGALLGVPWGARWFHASIERQLSHA